MKPNLRVLFALVTAAMLATPAIAADEEDFNRRVAQSDLDAFLMLDRDQDGRLTKEEVRGSIDMQARFDDIDINRDGIILTSEIERYVILRYGVAMSPATGPATSRQASTATGAKPQEPAGRKP